MNMSISAVNFGLMQTEMRSQYRTVIGFLNPVSLPTTLLFHPNHRNFGSFLAHLVLFSAQYLSSELQGDSRISPSEAVNR